MKKWTSPELITLSIENTKGNPGSKGNDQYIPDCIENVFEHIFGDHTGPCS